MDIYRGYTVTRTWRNPKGSPQVLGEVYLKKKNRKRNVRQLILENGYNLYIRKIDLMNDKNHFFGFRCIHGNVIVVINLCLENTLQTSVKVLGSIDILIVLVNFWF